MDKNLCPLLRLTGDKAGGTWRQPAQSATLPSPAVTCVRPAATGHQRPGPAGDDAAAGADDGIVGQTVDPTDTRDYGRLIAASLARNRERAWPVAVCSSGGAGVAVGADARSGQSEPAVAAGHCQPLECGISPGVIRLSDTRTTPPWLQNICAMTDV